MTTNISLLTPTCDQPVGIALLERYVARQSVAPMEHIVVDDGDVPATLTMGQTHIVRPRHEEGFHSLAKNILVGLEAAKGDAILILEHDDHYHPAHTQVCLEALEREPSTSCRTLRYWNVAHRMSRLTRSTGALHACALRREHMHLLERAARECLADSVGGGLDARLWALARWQGHQTPTVTSMKSLPGRPGLGRGHRPSGRQWRDDRNGWTLRRWIGSDAGVYMRMRT